ncbi:MAG TPA: NUDIX domain-containing protein [Solirubrobacteraceae bacterium]|jgi:ADP-ribose pyrophosphatase YjhB (NUDIX family)|nr:NUDIX domain-containing protein [Solirubrobacteraceae bacterium]
MQQPVILARGHWAAECVRARWSEEHYQPPETNARAADAAIAALRERGSPSHDGLSARLVAHAVRGGELLLELQPVRWALRLVEGDASQSMAALTVTRAADGRWLAGRRSAWLSSWPGRWALGAGGAVDLGESPADTLTRELDEEWALQPERLTVEALVCLPHQLVMVVGLAWLADGAQAQIEMDDEHDAYAWWPAEVADWPDEADEPLRRMAGLLVAHNA